MFFKKALKLIQLKMTMSEMKKITLDEINGWLDTEEEQIRELEDTETATIENETEREIGILLTGKENQWAVEQFQTA